MLHSRLVAIAGILSFGVVSIEFGFDAFVDRLADGSSTIAWVPQLDSIGQTVLMYSYLINAVVFGLSFIAIAALGYWYGKQADIAEEYPTLVASLSVGAVGGFGAFILILITVSSGGVSSLSGVMYFLVAFGGGAVAIAIQFSLVGLAGGALAHFGFDPFEYFGRSDSRQTAVATDC